jgi:phage-related protein
VTVVADKSIKFGLFADDQASAKFDRVGQAAESAGKKMHESSSGGEQMGRGIDRATEAADTLDTRAMGYRDTLTGVQDSMNGVSMIANGDLFNGFLTLGMGVGDLASGFANFLLPNLGKFSLASLRAGAASKIQAAGSLMAAAGQRVLNVAMRANPIGLVITALIILGTAFIVAYKKSETFRRIVQAAMGGVRAAGQAVAGFFRGTVGPAFSAVFAVVGAYAHAWRVVMSTAADGVRVAFSSVARVIAAPFHAAFAGIRAAWNNTIGGRGFSVPDWVPGIGGNSFNIPMLAAGGIVTKPTLIMAGEAGPEAIVPLGRGGPGLDGEQGSTVVVQLVADGRMLQEVLLRYKRNLGVPQLGLA